EWSTVGLCGEDNDTPEGGIVVTIYEAATGDNDESPALGYVENWGDTWLETVVERERVYTDSFTKVAELIRNFEASGYLEGDTIEDNEEESKKLDPITPGYEFAYKISLDAERHILDEQEEDRDPSHFHIDVRDINAVSADSNDLYNGFDASTDTSAEYELFNKIACIDLGGNELHLNNDEFGQGLLISLPILSTDTVTGDDNTWYGPDNTPYTCGGTLRIDTQFEGQVRITASVRVREVEIHTPRLQNVYGTATLIKRGTETSKAGVFTCRDFRYHGMYLEVEGVRFTAGAADAVRELDEQGNPIEDEWGPRWEGSYVYLGASDDLYASADYENTGSYEITGASSLPMEAKIYFREGTGSNAIDDEESIADLFGDGVNIAPRVNIYADGLRLGHVNVRTDAGYWDEQAIDDNGEQGKWIGYPTILTPDNLPQILLTHEDYATNQLRTLHVYGYVNSDWQHNIPLLRVGLDQDKNGVADALLSMDGQVVFFDELTKEEADAARAHIRVDQRLDENDKPMVDDKGNPIYNTTDNSPITYVVAGPANLLWRRDSDGEGNPESGMILVDPATIPMRLEYLEGGSVDRSGDITNGGDGFVWKDADGEDAACSTAYFETLREISDFLREQEHEFAVVLWVQANAAADGNFDLSWDRGHDEDGIYIVDESYGITTLYIMDGDGEEDAHPVLDLQGNSVYNADHRRDTAVYLDDDLIYKDGRFDLMGYGDWLFLGENSVTGDEWNNAVFDNITDLRVPQGTIRLGDTGTPGTDEKDFGRDLRLDASRILVHGGKWRVREVQLRAGALTNAEETGESRFPEYDDGLPLNAGGAGVLEVVKYRTDPVGGHYEESQDSALCVSQNINVSRNVQLERDRLTNANKAEYGYADLAYGDIEAFDLWVPQLDEAGRPVLSEHGGSFTTEEAPQGSVIVGMGAVLQVEGDVNGGQEYLSQPDVTQDPEDPAKLYFADWDGNVIADKNGRNNIRWVDMVDNNGNPISDPEYAHVDIISDGLVKLNGNADLYGLTLAKNSRTCVYDNLNMEAEEEIRLVGEEEKPIRYTTPAAGSFTYMEKGAAVYLAPGNHGAHEDHYLNFNNLAMLGADGEATLYVPVSIDENEDHYTALTIRGDAPATYSAGNMATLYGKYLPTLATAKEGDARLAIGMYSAGSVNGAGWFTGTLTDIPAGLDVLHTGETRWDEDRIGSVCILDSDGDVVEDLVPRYEYWDGTNEEGEPEGQPDGHLEYDYGYHVYRVKVEVDDETNPTRIDEFYGNDEEGDAFRSGSYVGSYATWAEAVTAVEEDAENRGESFIPHWEYDPDQDRDVIVMDGDAEYPAYAIRLLNGVAMGTGDNAMPENPSRLIIEGFEGGDVIRIDGEVTLKTPTTFHAVRLDAAKAGIHVGEDGWLQFNGVTGKLREISGNRSHQYGTDDISESRVEINAAAAWDDRIADMMFGDPDNWELDLVKGAAGIGTLAFGGGVYVCAIDEETEEGASIEAGRIEMWQPTDQNGDPLLDPENGKINTSLSAGSITTDEIDVDGATVDVTGGFSAVVAGIRNGCVVSSGGKLYIKNYLAMDSGALIETDSDFEVRGTVVMGDCDREDVEPQATISATGNVTIGDRLFSMCPGNRIFYGSLLNVKNVRILEPELLRKTILPLKREMDEEEGKPTGAFLQTEEENAEITAPANAILLCMIGDGEIDDYTAFYMDDCDDRVMGTATGSMQIFRYKAQTNEEGEYVLDDENNPVIIRSIDDYDIVDDVDLASRVFLFTGDEEDPAAFYLTKKPGKEILISGNLPGAVRLMSDTGVNESYDTLQEALNAIDALKDKTATYTVAISAAAATDDAANSVTPYVRVAGTGSAWKWTQPALKFPTNLAGLTIRAKNNSFMNPTDAAPCAVLYYSGDIKASCSLTLDHVVFRRWDNTACKSAREAAKEANNKAVAPTKVTLTSGVLRVKDLVVFDTPVIFDGSNKAEFENVMRQEENWFGVLYAAADFGDDEEGHPVIIHDYSSYVTAMPSLLDKYEGDPEINSLDHKLEYFSYVEGGFRNFARMECGTVMVLGEEAAGVKPPVLDHIAEFSLREGEFYLLDPEAKPGTATITNLSVEDGQFATGGNLTVTNLMLGDGVGMVAQIGEDMGVTAFGDFKVTGDIINRSRTGATLTVVQQLKQTANGAYTGGSALTVNGTVEKADEAVKPIRVKVLASNGIRPEGATAYKPVTFPQEVKKGEEALSKLLTAAKAAEDAFVPHDDNIRWGEGDDPNQPGKKAPAKPFNINDLDQYGYDGLYMVRKEKNDYYVESGTVVEVALAEGIVNEDNSVDDATAIAGASYIGVYRTWKEAVAAVDALKDKEASYTLVLVKDINCTKTKGSYTYAPAAITMPAQAAEVKVMSTDAVQDVDGNDATTGVQPHVLCFSGNVTLKQDTTFSNVAFAFWSNPTTENKNAAFAAGKYALTLDRFSLEGYAPASITGAKGSKLTVTGEPVTVLKNVSGFTEVDLYENLTLSEGAFTADTLTLEGDAVLRACNGAVTVTDVHAVDDGGNLHGIAFSKSSKGTGKSNLTVKGGIYAEDPEKPVILEVLPAEVPNAPSVQAADLALKVDPNNKDKCKVLVDNSGHIAEVGMTPTENIAVKTQKADPDNDGEENLWEGAYDDKAYLPVKVGKALYLADVREGSSEDNKKTILPAITEIYKNSGDHVFNESWYLDYTQAVTEIDNIGDPEGDYTINLGAFNPVKQKRPEAQDNSGITNDPNTYMIVTKDLNVTDANPYSAFPLPKKDRSAFVTVCGELQSLVEVCFTGKLTGFDGINFNNVVFHPCKSGNEATAGTFDITMGLGSRPDGADGESRHSELCFTGSEYTKNGVYVPSDLLVPGATIGKITGVKEVKGKNWATGIRFYDVQATLTTGFAGTADVRLDNSHVLTRGKNEIGRLEMFGEDHYDGAQLASYGELKVVDVDVKASDNTTWIAGKEDSKGNSLISISGNVTVDDASTVKYLAVRIINKDTKADTKGTELFVSDIADDDKCGYYTAEADYAGRKLVLAPAADAAAICGYGLLGDPGTGEDAIISYKTTDKYVVNGRKSAMKVLVSTYEVHPDTFDPDHPDTPVSPVAETYAKTWYEAVQIIENTGRPEYSYKLKLLNSGDILTGKPDKDGNATFGALVMPSKAAGFTVWAPNGVNATLKFSGALTAKCLTELKNVKLVSGKMTGGDFSEDAAGIALDAGTAVKGVPYKLILNDLYNANYPELRVSSIKGSGLQLKYTWVEATAASVNLTALNIDVGANLESNGAVNVTGLELGSSAILSATGAVTVSDAVLANGSKLTSTGGDITVKNTVTVDGGVRIESKAQEKKVTLGQIRGTADGAADNDTLEVRYKLTKPTMVNGNVTKAPVSNLKITGTCDGAKLLLVPQIWQPEGNGKHEGWYLLEHWDRIIREGNTESDRTEEQKAQADAYNYGLMVHKDTDFVPAKRLAEMPLMPVKFVRVRMAYAEYVATGDNGTVEFGYDEDMGTGKNQRLLKQGGNLFLTSLAPVVQV
ncbi:MAG: hypothetical protein IKO80_03390, partial [Lachnospiraceae bacterium]|nr:hypothetical protein [Lachnospiraceae bacterium]